MEVGSISANIELLISLVREDVRKQMKETDPELYDGSTKYIEHSRAMGKEASASRL